MEYSYLVIQLLFSDVLNKTMYIFMKQSFLNDVCVFKVEVEWLRPYGIFGSQEW
jgi:hypothetical protein